MRRLNKEFVFLLIIVAALVASAAMLVDAMRH
jgi:hypothetical protein